MKGYRKAKYVTRDDKSYPSQEVTPVHGIQLPVIPLSVSLPTNPAEGETEGARAPRALRVPQGPQGPRAKGRGSREAAALAPAAPTLPSHKMASSPPGPCGAARQQLSRGVMARPSSRDTLLNPCCLLLLNGILSTLYCHITSPGSISARV